MPAGPHAQVQITPHYEFVSLPGEESPVMGVLVEMQADGRPLVDRATGPVCHVVLALDLSASMNHPDKFPVLQAALGAMLDDLKRPTGGQVLLSVVVFSKGADVVMREVPARRVRKQDLFRALVRNRLTFGRYTDIAGALEQSGLIANDQCRSDRLMPVRVYLLTDGKPQDLPRARAMAERLSRIRADLHALAFGDDADVRLLQELFAGRRGGTVKVVRPQTIGHAFERVAVTSRNVVATRCRVSLELAPGVVGGDAYRYRPARVRFPTPAFLEGKHFAADLGTLELDRTYSLLFEVRLPETLDEVTQIGKVKIEIPSFGGPVTEVCELRLPRTAARTARGPVDVEVRTARDILGALNNADPEAALRALRLRRTLYEVEKRDPGLLSILDRAIGLLATTGSLDGLSPGEHATLMSHTCTGTGDDWEDILERAG